MPRHGLKELPPNHPIKLPLETLRMGTQMIDAAILYIYGDPSTGVRVTDTDELTEIAGCGRQHLVNTKNGHGWEGFRLDMLGEEFRKRRGGELGFISRNRSQEEVARIDRERQRQLGEIPGLEKQAGKIMSTLKIIPATDKSYGTLVSALDRITAMLAERTGEADKRREEEELRKALIRVEEQRARHRPDKPTERGADHSRTIELPAA